MEGKIYYDEYLELNIMCITVLGSIHVDLYIKIERLPEIGETIIGSGFTILPGGKGANQAVGCSRLGVKTYMIGRIGKEFSDFLLRNFRDNGVITDFIIVDEQYPTGVAFIILHEKTKENMIIIDPGAGRKINYIDIDRADDAIDLSKIVLLQLEIPLEANLYMCKKAKSKGKTVILNPAPAKSLPEDMLHYIDIITPNRVEAYQLTGIPVKDLSTAKEAGERLIQKGINTVIITLGSYGSVLVSTDKALHYPAFNVEIVDTTGAGDAFNAGLAAALSKGIDLEEAVVWANAAAALKLTKLGAQTGLPYLDELLDFLKKYPSYSSKLI
jgi:ribokinase